MFSISLESCEVKDFEAGCQKIIEEVNDLTSELFSAPCQSLDEIESRVAEAFRSLGRLYLYQF